MRVLGRVVYAVASEAKRRRRKEKPHSKWVKYFFFVVAIIYIMTDCAARLAQGRAAHGAKDDF